MDEADSVGSTSVRRFEDLASQMSTAISCFCPQWSLFQLVQLGEPTSLPTSVKEVCATIVHVVSPVKPGWESEDCPIGQPPDPIPKSTGDKSLVEKRRMKRRMKRRR
jgi:hypothetical protein